MDMLDVVMRLNGAIEPVGDSRIDSTRLENLKALCDLTELLFDRIEAVAEATDDHMASVKAAKDVAAKFIASARGVKVHRPLGCALAMRVMQSDLYPQLDAAERADCDELVQQNLEWFKRDSACGVEGMSK